MARIEYVNSVTGSIQEARGTDNRLSVSSRTDSRSYYRSRDDGQAYSLVFDHQSAAAGEYSVYWQNTSTTMALVIDAIGFNAVQNARIKLWEVTGTAAGRS